MRIMICKLSSKRKIEVVHEDTPENITKIQDTVKLALSYEKEIQAMPMDSQKGLNARQKRWEEMNKSIVQLYPKMVIPALLDQFRDTFVIEAENLI